MAKAPCTSIACFVLSLAVLVGSTLMGHAMSKYIWKNRPLIVFAPSTSDTRLADQQRVVGASRSGFVERDMVVIYVIGDSVSTMLGVPPGMSAATLRRRYGVSANAFRSLLVGKDGGVKRSSGRAISARSLFGLIDRMPMRRQEMRRRAQ